LTSAPIAIFSRCGGSKAGTANGEGNGNPFGAAGEGSPAATSGLAATGRSRPRAGSSSLGSAPRSVPSSSAGTRLAEACTQLFDPATLRPSDQGSLLAGPQNGAFTSEAACSRK